MIDDNTSSYEVGLDLRSAPTPAPGLLVAYSPGECLEKPYLCLGKAEVFGRRHPRLPLEDSSISKRHAVFVMENGVCAVEDAGSKNGTFVDGERIVARRPLGDGAVVRLGQSILVYHDNIAPVAYRRGDALAGMAGRFFTKKLVGDLLDAVLFRNRGILLAGPTGTGKELAARAVAGMLHRKLTVQNAARAVSEAEATASLFGVNERVFSGVAGRGGYIEQAEGGALFLDEAHALTPKMQQSLLRILEDGVLARIGDARGQKVDVRFVLATNRPGPDHGLERDFLARLKVVSLPPLCERPADIPCLFDHVLEAALGSAGKDPEEVLSRLDTSHYMALISNGFLDTNVRGLIAVADTITAKISRGAPPGAAVAAAFTDVVSEVEAPPGDPAGNGEKAPPVSVAGAARPQTLTPELVESIHRAEKGNVTDMQASLKRAGVVMSRQRIADLVDAMGLERIKRPRRR